MASSYPLAFIARTFSMLAVCFSVLTPIPLLAQVTIEEEKTFEEIVVTGSRIKRRDLESPSPITTLDRAAIEASPQATLEEMLNNMPQVTPDMSRGMNNGSNGQARINLRGMGTGRTLVMLNARRVAPSGVDSSVDINNIPQALIERVELITGGASTVYGSDALAGVVNFITRDDFQGLSLEASYGVTEQGDARYEDINIAYGTEFAGGSGRIAVYGGYYDREELFARERALSEDAWFENWETGELERGGSPAVPEGVIGFPEVDWGNGPNFTIFEPDGTPREWGGPDDLYDFQDVNFIQSPLTRYSGGVFANFEFASGYELYLESGFTRNEAAIELAAVPAFEFVLVNTDNPILTPETRQLLEDNALLEPGLAGIFVGRRMLETGPRHTDYERDYWRTVLGIKGELGGGWSIDGWVTYTTADEMDFLLNDVSASRFHQGFLVDPLTGQCVDPSGGCVPVDIFGEGRLSQEAAEFLRIPPMINITERTQKLASVFVTGVPFDTWAGPFDVAVGLEWRSDDAQFKADDALFTGDALGYNGDAPVNGIEEVWETYVEANIPLLQDAPLAHYLGLEVGARYSKYDNAGGDWTYKFGSSWVPNDAMRFRAMYQRSVRAPNNLELFQEQFSSFGSYVFSDPSEDPCSASADPVGNGYTEACIIQGLPADQIGIFEATPQFPSETIRGGNPNLVPEEAETFTAGVILTPDFMPNWNFTIDYYEIEIEGNIGEVSSSAVCFDLANTGNVFCENIVRDPATGNVVQVFDLFNNRGFVATSGIDVQIHYTSDLPDGLSIFGSGAEFSVHLVWTHMLDVENQENHVSSVINCSGFFNSPCRGTFGTTAAEDRIATNLQYSSGPLDITLASHWIGGTDNFGQVDHLFFGGPEANLAIPSTGSKNFLNLGLGYEFTESISARLNIANLTNQSAPFMADGAFANNTDNLLYDIYGRSYSLSLAIDLGN
jgi:outer membrane receptor protein involved in Fe transport